MKQTNNITVRVLTEDGFWRWRLVERGRHRRAILRQLAQRSHPDTWFPMVSDRAGCTPWSRLTIRERRRIAEAREYCGVEV